MFIRSVWQVFVFAIVFFAVHLRFSIPCHTQLATFTSRQFPNHENCHAIFRAMCVNRFHFQLCSLLLRCVLFRCCCLWVLWQQVKFVSDVYHHVPIILTCESEKNPSWNGSKLCIAHKWLCALQTNVYSYLFFSDRCIISILIPCHVIHIFYTNAYNACHVYVCLWVCVWLAFCLLIQSYHAVWQVNYRTSIHHSILIFF